MGVLVQLKSLIRFPIDIRRARRLLAEKPSDASRLTKRPIVLDLRTPKLLFDCGRHFASLAYHAAAAGSPFYVRCSPVLLAGIARKIHGREMLAEPHTSWLALDDPLPSGAFVLCDYDGGSAADQTSMLIGRDILRDLPVMPYPMHPATLRQLQRVSLIELRGEQDRSAIFFAGNQKPKYGDQKIRRNFGLLSRLEILGTLAEQFPDRTLVPGRQQDGLSGSSIPDHSNRHPIVLSDSRLNPIAACDWLPTLARTQFFLCCPGASQPTCHHLIEAMSVGTIPILEYGDRLAPPLRDGENAICFRGKRGLLEAIERIDRLSTEQLLKLRQNVADFYDRHLCGTRFLTALRDGRLGPRSRYVCMPFHETNFFQSHRTTAA